MGSSKKNKKPKLVKMGKIKRSKQGSSSNSRNQVEIYKKEMGEKAQNVLCNIIPKKLDYLDGILKSDRWQPEYSIKARQYCIDSIKQFEEKNKEIEELKKAQAKEQQEEQEEQEDEEGQDSALAAAAGVGTDNDEPVAKKAKQSSSATSTLSIELKEKESLSSFPVPKLECNEIVLELFEILKPELIGLGINCQVLHDWINLHIPKHEDGNNFGVEVQEEALQELAAVKEETFTSLEEQSAYHMARASIMEKITQEGNIKDLKIFIYEEDEKQCRRLRMMAMNLRTHYTTVLDTITKNYEKIINPKGSSSSCTLMY